MINVVSKINPLSRERLEAAMRDRIQAHIPKVVDAIAEEVKVALEVGMGDDIEVVLTKEKTGDTTRMTFASYGPTAIKRESERNVYKLTYANMNKILARIVW